MVKVPLATAIIASALSASAAHAAPVDLSTWTPEGPGTWNVQSGNDAVIQTVNGDPTVFYSDFQAFGNELGGTIRVNTTGDDDYIGFVLGFNPGDLTASSTDFLIVDWKQGNQGSFGCTANAGLSISRATAGLGNNAGGWCHVGDGVTELARANTLGNTGWADLTEYTFSIEYTSSNVKVFVDNVLQLDVNGSFSNGRFGFYNYSQEQVQYAGITQDVLPGGVPEPGTWALLIVGFGAVGGALRRRPQARTAIA